MGPGTSLDGKVTGFAIWAFQDVAFSTRWAHSINVQTPGIVGYMAEHYYQFEPTPWFIGEYGANGLSQEDIRSELVSMDDSARNPTNPFMGMAFFQFQAAYFKGGSEMNFGLFRLGERQIAETGDICDKGQACKKFPVWCLTTDTGALPEFVHGRAEAVASAWGGIINPSLMC